MACVGYTHRLALGGCLIGASFTTAFGQVRPNGQNLTPAIGRWRTATG
ncbi:hypothetical protein L915_10475 [Phytophthora nicotianae]|uniref:Uncharacterized protein n=1 Tax=Phytophthora nicotianae TaxID=4792 RepID=W2GQJ4_PHYNI|nr:hypothetical protein L915_10475 [Phytophthora nicotianae]ETL38022.1 hypothetical protein L916_10368 [Phytophthora nicotianae]